MTKLFDVLAEPRHPQAELEETGAEVLNGMLAQGQKASWQDSYSSWVVTVRPGALACYVKPSVALFLVKALALSEITSIDIVEAEERITFWFCGVASSCPHRSR